MSAAVARVQHAPGGLERCEPRAGAARAAERPAADPGGAGSGGAASAAARVFCALRGAARSFKRMCCSLEHAPK